MLPPKLIRVLVADSHEMSRYALRIFVETFDDLELVGEAQDGLEVLQLCAQLQPDIVLMSINLNGVDGIPTTISIREQFPHVNIVMLSYLDHAQDLEHAIAAGASSYLIKGISINEIAAAIRTANR